MSEWTIFGVLLIFLAIGGGFIGGFTNLMPELSNMTVTQGIMTMLIIVFVGFILIVIGIKEDKQNKQKKEAKKNGE